MFFSFFILFLPVILLFNSKTIAEPADELISAYCLVKKLI